MTYIVGDLGDAIKIECMWLKPICIRHMDESLKG